MGGKIHSFFYGDKLFYPQMLNTVALHDVVVMPEEFGFSEAWCEGKPVHLAQLFRNGRQARRQALYSKPVRVVDEPCVWGGVFHGHYGHFLIESMGSLYAFQKYGDRRIAWRNGRQDTIPPWASTILHLTSCDRNGYVFVNEPTLFKDIVFPLPGLMSDMWLTREQADAFAVFEKKPERGLRIWLSRSNIDSDNIVFTNERELEILLAERGWLIVHPEELSMEKQLDTLASGEVVMGCIGSAFHTLLLLKNPGSRYIVINRMNGDSEAHNQQFDMIAKARTSDYYVWEPPKHDAPPLRPRRTHHAWPWFAFDIEAIGRLLDRSNDFREKIDDYPGMTPISRREVNNSVRPLLCRHRREPADHLYYAYRRLRKECRPFKDAWVDLRNFWVRSR